EGPAEIERSLGIHLASIEAQGACLQLDTIEPIPLIRQSCADTRRKTDNGQARLPLLARRLLARHPYRSGGGRRDLHAEADLYAQGPDPHAGIPGAESEGQGSAADRG